MPTISALLLLAASISPAAEIAPGYVVKVDSGAVYLDFNEKSGASAGQPFQVYTEGDELKHPITGQSLGRLENKVAEGRISEVLALYSVGQLSPGAAGDVKPGMRAKLGAAPVAPAPAPAAAAPSQVNGGEHPPRWRSQTFPYQIAGMAVAEFEKGRLGTAMSDGVNIHLYDYPPASNKSKGDFTITGTGARVLSIVAADVDANGGAELFVTFYNQTFNRVETTILGLENGRWKEVGQIPWIVRDIQDPTGKIQIAVQQLVEDNTFPFSSIYPISYQDGKYGAGKTSIKPKRVDWIYDFTHATLDSAPATLYLTSTGHLRVQFEKGSWKTRDAYCQTPVRLRWPDHEGRLLEFHPPIRVAYDATGKAAIYAARNLSMLGNLAEPFGLFNGGELQRLSWNGVGLVVDWKTDLGGYAPAINLVDMGGKQDLAVAIVGTSGRSTVWIYDP